MKRSIHIGLVGLLTAGLVGCTGVVAPGVGPGGGTGSTSGTPGTPGSPGTPGTPGVPGTPGTPGTPGVPGTPGSPTVCTPGVPQTSQLPRLTRSQYDNTTRDLLGITLQPTAMPSSMLAPDTAGSVDKRAWDGYQTAADALAAQVLADTTARGKVITCTPTGDGSACARQFIEQFGRRAYRRPLTADEVTRFVTLYTNRAQLTATGTFDEAAKLIVRTFLVSPSFLTRAEISETPDGSYFVLNNYEVASRLSYMLWGSMPDEPLFTAAAGGKLATSAGILVEAQRMLKDPKARAKINDFHQQYAHMGEGTRWAQITRDPAVYPAFAQTMTPLMSEETKRFFDYVVFDKGGTFQDLMTSPVGFVNNTLAPLYGLNASQYGADLVQVNLDPATRSGLLTRLGFLTSQSLYDRPSAILRGAFIQKEILCAVIGAPPPGAEGTPQPTAGLATNRERTDAQTAGAACEGCHKAIINPTGFALEAYDAIGSYRQTEGGAPINTAATVVIGQATVPVTGAVDLMTKIAASPEAQRCYAQKWVQYAYERAPTTQDTCTVQTLAGNLTQGGYTIANLITDLTQSESFRYRAKE